MRKEKVTLEKLLIKEELKKRTLTHLELEVEVSLTWAYAKRPDLVDVEVLNYVIIEEVETTLSADYLSPKMATVEDYIVAHFENNAEYYYSKVRNNSSHLTIKEDLDIVAALDKNKQ